MQDLASTPSKAQQWLAAALSLLAAVVCGAAVSLLLVSQVPNRYIAAALFGFFFLLSAVAFIRTAFTAPRALRPKEQQVIAWVMLCLGAVGVPTGVSLPDPTGNKWWLVGCSLSGFAYGAAYLWQHRRNA